MNFLLRPAQTAAASVEQPSVSSNYQTDPNYASKHTTLEGLIAEDPFVQESIVEADGEDADGNGEEKRRLMASSSKIDVPIVDNYIDVAEDEGWIIIPNKELPDDWSEALDILSFCSLDRSFVFPGEQVHIMACLSAYKQDIEIITPFKVAAMMSKNGVGKNPKKQNGDIGYENEASSESLEASPDSQDVDQHVENLSKERMPEQDLSSSESLLRMEDHRRQTQTLLRKFENSHFFVRISESDKPLLSKSPPEESSESSEMVTVKVTADSAGTRKTEKAGGSLNAIIDRGKFEATVSGGLARNAVRCCSLPNGDIVVLLQVNIGVDFVRDPVLEIFQFEKYQDGNVTNDAQDNIVSGDQDPCGELLKWLLPLDNSIPPPSRPLSPPNLNSNSSIRSTSTKSNFSTSSGSQLFSFGHFRSYSMSSLPQNTTPPPVATHISRPSLDLADWEQFSSQKIVNNQKTESEGLLSFRGVPLEPDRFSVRCGLEGIYIPGRRWRKKIEIIQPIKIHSFSADCNTDDLLCVQIKNVSPAHAQDIVVYLDSITIVCEASKGGPPLSLPITCIEAGNGHSLPNLALRRGEEHSFILKPATSVCKTTKGHGERSSRSLHVQAGGLSTELLDEKRNASTADQYSVLVSCWCNCTESKLFFKQPTSWRPSVSRDLMIAVASEISTQNSSPNGRVTQLPVQVLTLQASNLTSEDLTLTVLAPASFTSPRSVVSLNSSPSTPMSPLISHSETHKKVSSEKQNSALQRINSVSSISENERLNGDCSRSVSINGSDLGCTHLWLKSRVPLGCVPSQSTSTIKLELLPLTDGIITLDSLKIHVKEKGLTYIPEHSLKINATSSIATGIV